MSKKRNRRMVELGKDILIVLLACSAIYMGANALVVGGLSGLFQKNDPQSAGVVTQQESSGVAWPVRMVISNWNGETMVRYGVQYDRAECEAQFQPVASLLRETLSSLGVAQVVSAREIQWALEENSSIYFDLLGEVPLSVLSGWLTGSEGVHSQNGTVRRLILTAEGKNVFLYYKDLMTGVYYMRTTEVVSVEQVHAVTDAVVGNGAQFAFEAEGYEYLDGYTLLLPEPPVPEVYIASNPVEGEQQAEMLEQNTNLGKLLRALSFPDNSYFYSGIDQVIRSGNDTLRISRQGMVRYNAAEGENSRYQVDSPTGQPTIYQVAEGCRRLAADSLGELAGEARLYLKEIRQIQTGWRVEFGYCLDGANVLVGDAGYAAHFVVEGDQITQFAMQLRSYTKAGEQNIVLPEQQALAAMQALGQRGSELMLSYHDQGGSRIGAVWTAN